MNTIIFLFMVAAAVVLVIGVIAMAVNGKFNKKNSNNLMRLRVLFQSIALAIVVLLVLMTT
jgi:ABC-type dipeptide/oligopeptide/nickel transport system permease subunit|tara:strand:- start:82 stop:264 length:183 start_codon:yes stop_codon:yes gene_type:complete